MYKICKTQKSADRQKVFEEGLLQAMLSRNYEDISVQDLCQQLQVPRKSFYRYFSGKDGALQALLDHTLLEFVQQNSRKRNQGELESFFVFWYEHRDLLKAVARSNLMDLLAERAIYYAIYEHMMPRQLQSMPLEVQQLSLTFVINGLLAMVIQWHRHNYRETPEELAQIARRMLTLPMMQK